MLLSAYICVREVYQNCNITAFDYYSACIKARVCAVLCINCFCAIMCRAAPPAGVSANVFASVKFTWANCNGNEHIINTHVMYSLVLYIILQIYLFHDVF